MADVVAKFKLKNGSKLPIGKSFISSLKSVSESTSDAGSINYGTLANTGSIEIQDGNGYISKMIDDGLLPVSDLDVDIEVNGEAFQQHITTDSDYDTEGNTLNISLSNFIKDFDVLKYKGYIYQNEPVTLYELFIHVLNSYYQYSYTDQLDTFFDSKTLDYIKNIIIEYPSIEYGKTYRQVLDELCTIAQLNMFVSSNKILKFVSARPKYASREEIKTLNWNDVVEDLKYTKILKNKYDGVEMTVTQVNDIVETSTPIYSWNSSQEYQSSSTNDSKNGQFVVLGVMAKTVAEVSATYYTGKISFPKKSANNLNQITGVLDKTNSYGIPNTTYSVNYTKSTGGAVMPTVMIEGIENVPLPNYTSTVSGMGELAQYDVENKKYKNISVSTTSTYDNLTASVSDDTNLHILEIVEDSLNKDNYVATFKVLVGYRKFASVYYPSSGLNKVLYGMAERVTPNSVDITIYGNKRTISFNDVSASSVGISSRKTKATVNSGGLLQTTTTYKDEEISEIIKKNILDDYKNGVSDGKLTINKPLVEVGDLIKCPNDKRVWRVVGKEFHYDGEYLFPLSVMQCFGSDESFGLFDNDGNVLYGWSELIQDGLITVEDGILKSVTVKRSGVLRIPDEITGFGESVLILNSYITGVELNDNITSISDSAFRGAKGLISFDTGENVVSLGGACLEYCDNLAELKIGPNITYIGNQAFAHNPKLKKVTYSATDFLNPEGNSYFFRNSGTSVGGIEVIVDEGVKTIPKYLFGVRGDSDNTITSVNIKSQILTDIGQYAFFGTKISTINLPESLASIGESAFEQSMIKSIKIPDNVTSIGVSAFYKCSNLENVKLPNGITALGWNMFAYCSSLKELIIPNTVTDVGRGVLSECTSIENLEVPLPELAEYGSFTIQGDLFGGTYGTKPVSLKRIVIKKGASTNSTINMNCFSGCSGLEEVVIGSGITVISNKAFDGITTLKRVVFEDTDGWKVSGNVIDVSDPEQNAVLLTDTYLSRTWIKS